MHILVCSKKQQLTLLNDDKILASYDVATAKNGLGEQRDTGKTPRGWHKIKAKIGSGVLLNTVFVGRRPTGEIYSAALAAKFPKRDWILTRILWLTGLEAGRNKFGDCDTMSRYIYIHGCPDSEPIGVPISHGCVRMRNDSLVELFEQVTVGTKVYIE